MARGYLSGLIVGAVVSGLGLGTVSVLSGPVGAPAPQAGDVEVPAGSGFSQPRDDTSAALPGTSDATDTTAAPEVDAPEPDDLASLQGDATQPAAQPETGSAEQRLTAPADAAGEAGVSVDVDDPVLPSPQSQAPEAPVTEEDLSISTDPAQPALPDVGADEAAFPAPEPAPAQGDEPTVEDAGSDSDTTDPSVTEEEATAVEAGDAPTPETPSEPVDAETAEITEPDTAAEPAGDTETATAPEPEAEPEATPEMSEPATQDEDVAEPAPSQVVEEETAAPEAAEAAEISDSTIGNLAPEVKTNRLPSVGDEPEPESAEPAQDAEVEQVAMEEAADTRPPLEKFAASFENPEAKPLMSIILIDDGSSPVGLQALESFPYPLTFAVASNWDGAAEAMGKYRAAGFEVLALTDLPEGAGPQDAEQAMQAVFSTLPEAVGIMEGTGSGLQSSRAAAEQLAPILLDSGHGVVLFPKGLNTAQKLLAREGVPSAAVFRDFDAKGQNATVIRRFLDQAAFKAGQEGAGVVMVGRLRPDTVSALLLWGLQDRASRVALAPVSALLSGGE